jgi:hypothetical protein
MHNSSYGWSAWSTPNKISEKEESRVTMTDSKRETRKRESVPDSFEGKWFFLFLTLIKEPHMQSVFYTDVALATGNDDLFERLCATCRQCTQCELPGHKAMDEICSMNRAETDAKEN